MTRNARYLASLLVILGLFALPPSMSEGLSASEVLTIPITAGAANGCVMCSDWCGDGYHDAWDDDPQLEEWDRAGGAHSISDPCWSGTCDTKHGPCVLGAPDAITNQDLETLRALVLADDAPAIALLVGKRPQQINVNTTRLAIQVSNCKKSVVAHFPISQEMVHRITAAAN